MTEFVAFEKLARWSRNIVITEKLDGTNAAVVIVDGLIGVHPPGAVAKVGNLDIFAQSRTQFIAAEPKTADNYGFARWVVENAEELAKLGCGRHFGEWWGAGIQRRYGLDEKRFSLFNTGRWYDPRDSAGEEVESRTAVPPCCHVVPVLLHGPNDSNAINACLQLLAERGSYAAPGFMDPEGIVIYHAASGMSFKKTIKKDEVPKSVAEQQAAASRTSAPRNEQ